VFDTVGGLFVFVAQGRNLVPVGEASFLARQVEHFRAGGVRTVLRKCLKLLTLAISWPVAFVVTIGIRLMSPIVLVRVGWLFSSRMGNLARWPEIYLCRRDTGVSFERKRIVDIWFHSSIPSNSFLAEMWKHELHIGPRWVFRRVDFLQRRLPNTEKYLQPQSWEFEDDLGCHISTTSAHLKFSNAEIARGHNELKLLGIPSGAKYVCLMVRDSAYLAQHRPGEDWSFYHYRDGRIEDYLLAAEKLTEKGYLVVRMGATADTRLRSENKMIIDYAFYENRNEFLDIYLGAHCEFAIGTGVGLEEIPVIFRRPVCYTGVINWKVALSRGYLMVGKKYFNEKTNEFLSLRQILEFEAKSNFSMDKNYYESSGIIPQHNSPKEIADLVLEMESRVSQRWTDPPDSDELQARFWKALSDVGLELTTRKGFGISYGPGISFVGYEFLKINQDWFLPEVAKMRSITK